MYVPDSSVQDSYGVIKYFTGASVHTYVAGLLTEFPKTAKLRHRMAQLV